MFDFLRPWEVRNVNEAINALFQLNKNAEVGKVTYRSCMFWIDRVTVSDSNPWIRNELFHSEWHLTLFAIESQNDGFNIFTNLQEIMGCAQMLWPWHFRNVDKTLNTGSDFYKSTVIGDDNNFTFDSITNIESFAQRIPWMRSKLLET